MTARGDRIYLTVHREGAGMPHGLVAGGMLERLERLVDLVRLGVEEV